MTRQLLSKFLLWAFALLTLPAAGQTVWNGNIDTDWYNESKTEFTISTAAELAGLAKLVNDYTEDFQDKTIKLTRDITLNENVLNENGELNGDGSNLKQWTPIGKSGAPFFGAFDGQGHIISGIYISNSSDYQGLFGYVDGGTIQNVTVADSYIKGDQYVGGIVGYNDSDSKVSNCSYSGTVTGTGAYAYVGGIVGANNSGGTVSNCSNSGKVTGTSSNAYVGGIVGNNYGTVSNCSNCGDVSGGNMGGIVRYNGFGSEVSNCYYLEKEGLQGVGAGSGTSTNVEPKSEDEYKSGEVAHLLDPDGDTWGQKLDGNSYPVPLACLSADEQAAYKIYSVTFTYKETPDAEKETEVIRYGNSDTPITSPAAPEGYTYTWEPELPTTFGGLGSEKTFTGTLVEKPEEPEPEEPEEPTEPEEPDTPHIEYYDVRFVQPNDSVNFDYKSDQVRKGNTFSFSASAAEGYDPKTLVVEYRRGPVGIWREATLDTDGKYHIRANYADLYIRARVEPLNPTGIEQVGDEAVEVYTEGDAIRVYTPDKEKVVIIAIGGKLVRMEEQVGTRRYTGLSDGVYIVRIGERSWKVRL